MAANWKTERLGNLFQIKPPKIEAKKRLSSDDLVSFVPMEDLRILKKNFIASKVKYLKEVSDNYTYFAENDVLLAKITPCFENGKMGIAYNLTNGIGFGSSEFVVFRSQGIVIPEYLFYFLSTKQFREEGKKRMSGAVGHKRVQKEFIENYLISFPESISEQKRIVTILDKSFAAIDKARENTKINIKNILETFDSCLQSTSSKTEKLGHLINLTTGKLDANAATQNGKYPFFTCSRDTFFINEYAFDCEAILLAGNNAVGDFNVKHYKGKFNAYQRTYIITIKDEGKILYMYLYFQILKNLKKFKEKSVGTGTKFLKLGLIKELEIYLPPIADQHKIIIKLDKLSTEINKIKTIYRNKLNFLDELKNSFLQQAFTGKLSQAGSLLEAHL